MQINQNSGDCDLSSGGCRDQSQNQYIVVEIDQNSGEVVEISCRIKVIVEIDQSSGDCDQSSRD